MNRSSQRKQRQAAGKTFPHEPSTSIDFTNKWDMSDVALKLDNGDKLLHVNKTILAAYSPFFKALFYSDFAESMQDVVEVQINYWAMLEILKILHHVDRNFGVEDHKLYSAKELALLYNAADAFDFPLIRELCRQQFVQIAPKDAFEVSIQLELHKEKSEILKKMSFEDIEEYLKKGVTDLVLSPVDAAVIIEKCKEAEIKKIRCTNCGGTNVTKNGHYGHGYYTCNNCRIEFHSRTQ